MTETPARKPRKWRRLAVLLSVILLLFVLDYWLYPRFVTPGGLVDNRGENGIWLRYTWYFGEHPDSGLDALAATLRQHGITDAFFHVRSVDARGVLQFHDGDAARHLNDRLAALSPSLRRFARIYAGNSSAGGKVQLDDPKVRDRMVAEAVWLVSVCGFQGIQWDYESCQDGDQGFLKLLEETRSGLPDGTPVSVAAPTWYPPPFGSEGWSPGYFGEVAKRCDQIAVMAYDSAAYFPRAYTIWVSNQVQVVTRAVARANPKCRVLIGVPTYRDGTISHNPRAENIALALTGVRQGLENSNRSAWQGVAVFADSTTTPSDWRTFDRLWPASR